ncbi:MAG: cytochrome-c peroxidase, partial [Chitinophagales bacterium]
MEKDNNRQKYLEIAAPKGFPPIPIPENNKPTETRIELGKKLFFDPLLSLDYSISCASCHHPSNAFSDTVALSKGVKQHLGFRNA